MQIVKAMLSATSAVVLSCSLALTPVAALAQQAAPPKIDGFDVEQARRLTAGSKLAFTLYGTPGGTATARIGGVNTRVLFDEVEAGVYEATYVIKAADGLTAQTPVTANLRIGNQIAAGTLDESLLKGAKLAAQTPVAAVVLPKIDRFEIDAPTSLAAGEQLFFTVRGTPEAKTSVRVPGVKGKLLLNESQPGAYEGSYVIKDRDRVATDARAVATLRIGEREVSASLDRALLARPGRAPSERRAAKVCANCGTVEAVNLVEVQGDGSYVGKIAGGVLGGLIGSQIGSGRGTTAAEIAGVVGGAVLGNEAEKRMKKTVHWDVVARMQGGGAQTVTYAAQPAFRVGDKVRVENGVLVSNQ
jgi:outer membrane lipoprotein SlyB